MWTHWARVDAFVGDLGELPLERCGRIGLAAQPAAADRAAAEREEHARIAERRQDVCSI